jgi:hypothetical protein
MRINSNLRTGTGARSNSWPSTSVRLGETKLSQVAKRLGVPVAALRSANPHLKSDKVVSGQELSVPTGLHAADQALSASPQLIPVESTPVPSPATASSAFNEQLSAVLMDALTRLGVDQNEVDITIGNSGNQQEIVIRYRANLVSAGITINDRISRNPFGGSTQPRSITPLRTANPFNPGTSAASIPTPVPDVPFSPWCPTNAPRDTRDARPQGGGQLKPSGAPLIQPSAQAVSNQYDYTGPAARNPYFTSPSNPLRSGYVLGFEKWFEEASVLGGQAGPVRLNKINYATREGAEEALRLVQMFIPGARITSSVWSGGPFTANRPTYYIELPGGQQMNAGGVLYSYYNGGRGVTTASDADLRRTLGLA